MKKCQELSWDAHGIFWQQDFPYFRVAKNVSPRLETEFTSQDTPGILISNFGERHVGVTPAENQHSGSPSWVGSNLRLAPSSDFFLVGRGISLDKRPAQLYTHSSLVMLRSIVACVSWVSTAIDAPSLKHLKQWEVTLHSYDPAVWDHERTGEVDQLRPRELGLIMSTRCKQVLNWNYEPRSGETRWTLFLWKGLVFFSAIPRRKIILLQVDCGKFAEQSNLYVFVSPLARWALKRTNFWHNSDAS